MVPEVHTVFADTRLLYREIRREEEQLRLRDFQEEQLETIADVCDEVVNLGWLVNEQREVMNKLTAALDHHMRVIQWMITKEKRSRRQLGRIRKFAIKKADALRRNSADTTRSSTT